MTCQPLEGQKALVTGAASEIGKGIARAPLRVADHMKERLG